MIIAYVLDDTLDKTDGVQQYVTTVGEHMRSLGHEVHYVVGKTLRTDLKHIHSVATLFSTRFNGNTVRTPLPTRAKHIKKVVEQIHPDVVHIQLPTSPLFGARLLARLPASTRVIGTWHTFPATGLQRYANKVLSIGLRSSLRRINHFVAVSKPTADFAKDCYGVDSTVIPNAVSLHTFETKQPIDKKPTILFLGRFVERKGPRLLIAALAELARAGIGMPRVVMGGSGPQLKTCQSLSKRLGLEVEFTGFVPERDKPAFLSRATIAVFPSTSGEAFGISLVEAMAGGHSIVVGGNNPGYASILGKQQLLLINPKHTTRFADTLRMLLTLPPSEQRKLSQWLKHEAQQYDTPVVCAKLLRLYAVRDHS